MSETTLQRIIGTVADTFAVDPAGMGRDTVADDVDGWDSVSHALLILALEDKVGRQLPFAETLSMPNLGALADFIDAQSAA